MDKHMIHIDDFVRQKLRDREEPERPGAWLAMRELLDKEMPTVAGAAFNWRRMTGYFTALLLITAVSFGGYKLYEQSEHPSSQQAMASNGAPASHPAGTTTDASLPSEPKVSLPPAISAGTSASPRHTGPIKTGHVAARTANTVQNPEATAANTQSAKVSGAGDAPNNNGFAILASAKDNMARQDQSTGNTVAAVGTGMEASNASSTINSSINGATVNGHRIMPASGGPMIPSALRTIVPVSTTATGAIAPAPVTPKPVRLIHDTIQRIEIVYHRVFDPIADAYHFRLDTFPMTPLIIDRPVYEEPKLVVADSRTSGSDKVSSHKRGRRSTSKAVDAGAESKIAAGAAKTGNDAGTPDNPAPKASSSDVSPASSDNSGSTASDLKISKRHFSLFDLSKVTAIVEHVKTSLAKVEIYPGVMMGINASLSSTNTLGGGQAGITTLISINDWWTVMTELKYFHRFNTGSTVRDNYLAISDTSISFPPSQQGYKQYNWKEDTVNHYFNYDVIRTLELPLALRYNWGRFYAMGGLNLTYGLAIQASEVTRAQNNPQSRMNLRPNTHNTESFVPNSEPLVRISDFGSRFGTGYLIGGGYMFSPGVYVDLRLTQTFWDNAGTTGAKQVSSDLLHTPSFQLAVGYRFGKKK